MDDAAFVRFRSVLTAAVAARDEGALRPLLTEDVITGADAPKGPEALLAMLRGGAWREWQAVLSMGAARYEKGFVAPYLFGKFPEDLEGFEHAVVVRPGAVLRSRPDAAATVVCPLDYDILRISEFKPEAAWLPAQRLDGPKGWVAAGHVRTTGEPRIFFEKRAGAWKVTACASGA